MNDSNATQVAFQRMIEEIKQYLFRGFDIHVMKINRVGDAVMAPA
jgi:hypothetical protein